MPPLSRWYVRTAFIYLLGGITIGSLLLANKGVPFYPAIWHWLPLHIEYLLIGWTLQLSLGVAFWIMPRFWKSPRRGNVMGAYLAFGLLNSGLVCVTVGVLFSQSWMLVIGRVLEVGTAVSFTHAIWSRIVSRDG